MRGTVVEGTRAAARIGGISLPASKAVLGSQNFGSARSGLATVSPQSGGTDVSTTHITGRVCWLLRRLYVRMRKAEQRFFGLGAHSGIPHSVGQGVQSESDAQAKPATVPGTAVAVSSATTRSASANVTRTGSSGELG